VWIPRRVRLVTTVASGLGGKARNGQQRFELSAACEVDNQMEGDLTLD
jgi:hypothetical protein